MPSLLSHLAAGARWSPRPLSRSIGCPKQRVAKAPTSAISYRMDKSRICSARREFKALSEAAADIDAV